MVEGEGLLLCEITFFFVAPGEKDHNLVEEKKVTRTHTAFEMITTSKTDRTITPPVEYKGRVRATPNTIQYNTIHTAFGQWSGERTKNERDLD